MECPGGTLKSGHLHFPVGRPDVRGNVGGTENDARKEIKTVGQGVEIAFREEDEPRTERGEESDLGEGEGKRKPATFLEERGSHRYGTGQGRRREHIQGEVGGRMKEENTGEGYRHAGH
ncbi:hypothetical protein NDU88_006345 [Pleurodeles waltl]|uniref:Uncharacterized protein n=1 Tax=Pleurodeles waltl TaxID=8319 RepID=A0AAV7ULN5_PLEWA|nr:hypothetical protein NDU88_006345 [Pleurodeles waltl]